LSSFLSDNPHSLICFSATWCGPCKASKPQLEALAAQYTNESTSNVSCGIAYEHALGDEIKAYKIRAFPTYVLFAGTEELGRIQGVNFDGIKQLVSQHCKSHEFGGGNSLGGSSGTAVEDARAKRLARFGGGGHGNVPANDGSKKVGAGGDVNGGGEETYEYKEEDNDEEMKDASPTDETVKTDGEGAKKEADDAKMDVDEPASAEKLDKMVEGNSDEVEFVDPTDDMKPEDIKRLTEEYGFPLLVSQKGLHHGGGTVDGAAAWICDHMEDADINEPLAKVPKNKAGGTVKSYRCVATGKLFTDMVALEFYANKTGRADFEECTEEKKPLTAEEKSARVLEIKALLKAKRTEREALEKEESVANEKQRRFMGQEMVKTREQMESDQRKRQVRERKKEKSNAIREKQRILAELEKDKRERAANKGKLKSRLGVEGYNPDAIQYDVGNGDAAGEDQERKKPKKTPPSVAKIDEYITKVSSYRAGGDGGKCLKVLKAYLGNVVKHPNEMKYKKINMDNKAYKTRVKPFVGAKNLLLAIGFVPIEDGTALELAEDADLKVVDMALGKVEKAYGEYAK